MSDYALAEATVIVTADEHASRVAGKVCYNLTKSIEGARVEVLKRPTVCYTIF